MPRPIADPLAGATRLLIDGTNLLHALARTGGPLPAVAVTGRLRALVPPGVAVTLVLDGGPAPGGSDRRLTSGIEVRYSGRRSADALLGDLAASHPGGVLVVTDDIALGASLRAAGARTARTSWLADRLSRQRLEAPAAGRPRPPHSPGPAGSDGTGDDDERPRWKPGRGATRKTGNPKRGRRPA
jgi:hypothetical protein